MWRSISRFRFGPPLVFTVLFQRTVCASCGDAAPDRAADGHEWNTYSDFLCIIQPCHYTSGWSFHHRRLPWQRYARHDRVDPSRELTFVYSSLPSTAASCSLQARQNRFPLGTRVSPQAVQVMPHPTHTTSLSKTLHHGFVGDYTTTAKILWEFLIMYLYMFETKQYIDKSWCRVRP